MKKVLKHVFALLAFISLFLMLGTAGSLDLNEVEEYTGFKWMFIYLVAFAVFAVAGGLCSECKEEE